VIDYLVGDATEPKTVHGTRVICHVCNNRGAWGAGFVLALSRKWFAPGETYKQAFRDAIPPRLGQVQLVTVGDGLFVANLIAQNGFPTAQRSTALDYNALEVCLRFLAASAGRDWSFHMPRIGCGIAGGDWSRVCKLIEATIGRDWPVTVYDLPAPTGPRHAVLR
jgi:O-acetyl-ADP-ribose deacetylase (regulator of RNase III)